MKTIVYYLNAEYEPGKHTIVRVWSDRFDKPLPEVNEPINAPFSILEIDERYNLSLAKDVWDYMRRIDPILGTSTPQYYVDNTSQLRNIDTDAVIPIIPNPEKADWAMSILAGATDAQIDTWFTNNVTNVTQAKNVMAMMAKLIARLAREVDFE